ncbi:YhgE/Pip family protein [Streptococcus pseudoporcinus]|uniref:Membrane protein n=1 Tax=Streptococcus pseudoporcinus TaxID=361101 RepID=A0A4V6L3S5_9STRE|nr:YhgE/Pip domain-containing protein [Streptococcus pseudoporcinus]VTS26717.1 membrane protein [Streptococcus pseudoporcinus]VUC71839.1 membrane protein [Streptococcus pseudoporcinus]VUD01021.1 membrane protein [Streptococcus pseudoporcinus]VUD01283.1 membrane protein [Streptococcus pseudoporcinus]
MLEELKALLKNPKLIITMIGVALVPALYNLSFLGSMWDPYGRVEDLPIAVVNHDRTAKLNQKDLHIGKDMVDKMSKNKDLDYHFVSEKKAENGLRDGDYYMVVTLPKDLSRKATTLLENNPEKLVIQYQTSRGHGMVASKMSEAAMAKLKSSVSDNISRTYTTSVFQSMSNLQTGLENASTGSGQLAQGANSAKVGSQEITRNLGSLANGSQTLDQGVSQLNSGLVTYTGGVSQLNNGISKFSSQLPLYLDAISQLSNGAGQLTAGLNKLASETTMSQEETQGVQALQVGLPQLNNAIQELNNAVSGLSVPNTADLMEALTGISNLAQGIIDSEASSTSSKLASLQATSTYKSLTPEQQAELSQAISATPSNATAGAQRILAIITVLKTKLANLPNNSNVSQLQASVNKIANLSNQALPQASAALVKLSAGVKSVNSGVTNQLLPGSYKISSALASLNSKNQEILTGLTAISSGSKQLNVNSNALLEGTQKLATGTNDLSQGAVQLTNGSAKLTDGLATMSSGLSTLQMSLAEASHKLNLVSVKEKNAKAVASPVALSEKDNDSVKTNGIGMAPYMIAVSLMVVALSTNVIFATSLSGRPVKNRWDWAKQKFIINGFISTLSSLILYGAIQFLGFEANYELKTLTFIILSGWTLMALVTALVGWDDRYGSFASLAMLLLQVGSSGGSYPIELSGRFFQTLHPYLPMSYIVSGLRETISLTGQIGLEVNILTGFLVGFLVLALIIYRPKNSQ